MDDGQDSSEDLLPWMVKKKLIFSLKKITKNVLTIYPKINQNFIINAVSVMAFTSQRGFTDNYLQASQIWVIVNDFNTNLKRSHVTTESEKTVCRLPVKLYVKFFCSQAEIGNPPREKRIVLKFLRKFEDNFLSKKVITKPQGFLVSTEFSTGEKVSLVRNND